MPRGSRGGRRTGKVGTAYSNRSDLQGTSLHSKQYGEGAARAASTAAVPVGPPPNTASVPGAPAPTPAAPAGPAPGTLGGLLDPTARPDEPLTAGLAIGAGRGPQGLPTSDVATDPDEDALRAIYRAHPSKALRELIETMEQG